MPKINHAHRFKRLKYKSGNAIYFCVLPDCNVKYATALALGKKAICWRCGEEFYMNEYSIRLARPHCMKCHKSKDELIITNKSPIMPGDVIHLEPESLSERLANTIKQAQTEEDEI